MGHSPQFGPKLGHKKDKNELSVTIPTFVSCESIYHRASNSASGPKISIHQGGQNQKMCVSYWTFCDHYLPDKIFP